MRGLSRHPDCINPARPSSRAWTGMASEDSTLLADESSGPQADAAGGTPNAEPPGSAHPPGPVGESLARLSALDPQQQLPSTIDNVFAAAEVALSLPGPGEPDRSVVPPAIDPLVALVERARQGEPGATRSLLAAVAGPVRAACRAILGRQHPDLEDALQDCLVGLVCALPAYRGEGKFVHYALRIATRTALAMRRRARAAGRHHDREGWSDEQALLRESSPGEETLAAERRRLWQKLLSELPAAQAETLVLRAVFELSIDEIARAYGTSRNTVKTRLRLAKDALRRRIARDGTLRGALGGC